MFKTHGDTKQRFSFRKSSLGVASVLIASFFLGGGQVMADDFEPASPEVVQVSPDSETVSDQLAETETDTEAPEALATDNKVSDTAETSEVINADKPADFDLSTEKEANPSENSETTVSASLAEPAASKPAVEETAEETDKGESILAIKPAELMASLATGSATRSAESTIYSSTDETATRELRANSERASSKSLTSNRKSFEEINKESKATEREFLRGNFSAIAGDWINGNGEWYRITEDGKATRKLLSDETAVTVDLMGEQEFFYSETIPVSYLYNNADGGAEWNYIRYAPPGFIFENRLTPSFDYSDRTKARLLSRATTDPAISLKDVKKFFYRVEDFQSVDYSALNYDSEEPLSLETMFNVVNSFKSDYYEDKSRQEMSGIWKNAKGETLLVSPYSTAIKENGTYFKLLSGYGSGEGNHQLLAEFHQKDGSGGSPWGAIFHYFPAGVRFRDYQGEGLLYNTTDPTRFNEDRIYLGTDIQNLANHLDDIYYRFAPYPEDISLKKISTQPPAEPTPVPLPNPTSVPVPTSEVDQMRQSFLTGDFSALTGIWQNGEGDRVLITADGKAVFKASPTITHQLKRTEFDASMESGAEVSFQGAPLSGGPGGFMGRFAPEGVAFSPGVASSEVDDSDQSRPRLIFGNGRQASIKNKAYYRVDKVVNDTTNHLPETQPLARPTIRRASLKLSKAKDLINLFNPGSEDYSRYLNDEFDLRIAYNDHTHAQNNYVKITNSKENSGLVLVYDGLENTYVTRGKFTNDILRTLSGNFEITLHEIKDSDGDGVLDAEDKNPVSWDFSERDAAIFANLAYKRADESEEEHKQRLTKLFDPDRRSELTEEPQRGLNLKDTDEELFKNWRHVASIQDTYREYFDQTVWDRTLKLLSYTLAGAGAGAGAGAVAGPGGAGLGAIAGAVLGLPAGVTSELVLDGLKDLKSNASAFVDSKGKQAVIAFRGTDENIPELILDALIAGSANNPKDNPFPAIARHQVDTLIQKLQSAYSGLEKIYITGHSLGGHLSFQAGVHLLTSPIKDKVKAIYNFNGPGFTEGGAQELGLLLLLTNSTTNDKNYKIAKEAHDSGKTSFIRIKTAYQGLSSHGNRPATIGHSPNEEKNPQIYPPKYTIAQGIGSYYHTIESLFYDLDQGYRTSKPSYKEYNAKTIQGSILYSLLQKEHIVKASETFAGLPKFLNGSTDNRLTDPVTSVTLMNVPSGMRLEVQRKSRNSVSAPSQLVGADYDLYDITLWDAFGKEVHHFDKDITIKLPVDPTKVAKETFHIDINGTIYHKFDLVLTTEIGADGKEYNYAWIRTPHLSLYGIVYEKSNSTSAPGGGNGAVNSGGSVLLQPHGQTTSATGTSQSSSGQSGEATNQMVPSGTSGGGSDRGPQTEPVGNTSTEQPVGQGGLETPQPAQRPGESPALQANPTYTAGQQGYVFASPSATAQTRSASGAHLLPQTGSAEATSAIFSVLGLISLAGASYGLRSRQEEN